MAVCLSLGRCRPWVLCALVISCLAVISSSAAPKRRSTSAGESSRARPDRDSKTKATPLPATRAKPGAKSSTSGRSSRPAPTAREAAPTRGPGRSSAASSARRGADLGAARGPRGRERDYLDEAPPKRGAGRRERYDDQDEEDEYGYGSQALVPARRRVVKPSMWTGLSQGLKNKASHAGEDAKGKLWEWRSIAKGKFSSNMERFMLMLTWPDDNPVEPQFKQDLMHFLTIEDDYLGEMHERNPYRRILRKLYGRLCEQDYRIVLKALVLVHAMSRDLDPEPSSRVRKHLLRLRNEVNPKKPDEFLFQANRVAAVTPAGQPFVPLIRAYNAFVFRRVSAFEGGWKKLNQNVASSKTTEAEALKTLEALDTLVCFGVRCKVERKEQLNAITRNILQLTGRDLMDLWKLYVTTVDRLVAGKYAGGSKKRPARKDVSRVLKKGEETQAALDQYLEQNRKFVKDRSTFDDNQLDQDSISTFLASYDKSPKKAAAPTPTPTPPKATPPKARASPATGSAPAPGPLKAPPAAPLKAAPLKAAPLKAAPALEDSSDAEGDTLEDEEDEASESGEEEEGEEEDNEEGEGEEEDDDEYEEEDGDEDDLEEEDGEEDEEDEYEEDEDEEDYEED